MGPFGTFIRFVISLAVFIAVLILGIVFAPQLMSLVGNLPGNWNIQSGNTTVVVPLLGSIVASVLLTIVVNLIMLPFRRRSAL